MENNSETKKENVVIKNCDVVRTLQGLTEIGNLDIEDYKLNYGIARSISNLQQSAKIYEKTLTSIQKKYFKKEDNGNFSVDEHGQHVFESKEKRTEMEIEIEKLGDTDCGAKVFKMKASDLKNVKGVKANFISKVMELIIDDVNID